MQKIREKQNGEKPFIILICEDNCTGCFMKIYNIAQYNCHMSKYEMSKYLQSNRPSFNIKNEK